jgi:NACalpha-BTF3-like transcription factor
MMQVEAVILRKKHANYIINANNIIPFNFKQVNKSINNSLTFAV